MQFCVRPVSNQSRAGTAPIDAHAGAHRASGSPPYATMKRLVYLVLPGMLLASPARGDQSAPAAIVVARAVVVVRKGVTVRSDARPQSEVLLKPRERTCDVPGDPKAEPKPPNGCRMIVYDLP